MSYGCYSYQCVLVFCELLGAQRYVSYTSLLELNISLPGHVISSKLLSLYLWFPHANDDNCNPYVTGLWWKLYKLINVKHLTQCLEYTTCSMHINYYLHSTMLNLEPGALYRITIVRLSERINKINFKHCLLTSHFLSTYYCFSHCTYYMCSIIS